MLEVQVDFTVQGRKTSEGDGRTAADIEREMEEMRRRLQEKEAEEVSQEIEERR